MKAVFLDRDGVVVADKGYVYKRSDFELLVGVPEAIKKLNRANFLVIIVTNQSGVARGYYSEDDLKLFNSYMISKLEKHGAKIDAIYYCPHYKEAKLDEYRKDCECRKPKPGMLVKAAKEYGIDLNASWVVGDKISDVLAGKAAGCKTLFIGKEKGGADVFAKDLNEAVDYIIGQ